jgi:ABC-type sugar transport system substrate-binding protein
MKKKIVSVLLTAVLACGLAACGGSSEPAASSAPAAEAAASSAAAEEEAPAEEEAAPAEEAPAEETAPVEGETPRIAFVGKVEGQPWWDHVQASVMEWKDATGVDVVYQAPAEVDAAAQVQIITDLVNQGEIDALLFSPNDPDACEAICKQARDQGIIVIAT